MAIHHILDDILLDRSLNITIDLWIGLMLTLQSFILWKLLPEIKGMARNSSVLGSLFKPKKSDTS